MSNLHSRTSSHLERAKKVIPAGTSTMSKGYTRYVVGPSPLFVARAKGAHFIDLDGRRYLDFGMGLGACILGYSYPEVNRAIRDALTTGIIYTLPSYMEAEVAEQLLSYLPWAEQLRWAKNGTDVTSAAVRMARAYTGRDKVVHSGYHGWQDWSVATTPPALGVPESAKALSTSFTLDTAGTGEAMQLLAERNVAAVVVEVAQRACIDDVPLRNLRRWCSEYGTILVFDEVLSGFRYRMGSASEVEPDLGCYGKAIANGMPLSALVGKRDLMKLLEPNGVFFSGTFGGEVLSLAACRETLKVLEKDKVHERLRRMGWVLSEGVNDEAAELHILGPVPGPYLPRNLQLSGDGARTVFNWNFSPTEKDYFQQECVKAGLLFIGAHNMSASHTWDDLQVAIGTYKHVLREMSALGWDQEELGRRLEGPPTTPAYRMQ